MKFVGVSLVVILSIIGLVAIGYMGYLEKTKLFFPEKEIKYTPKDYGLEYEDIFFSTGDNLLINGWFIPAQDSVCTILFSHGNADNISTILEPIKVLHDLNFNVFVFDYRGYGKSQGVPTEKGVYADIESAYQYLINKRNIQTEEVVVYGASLGGAVAIDLAARNKVKALILEGTFSNARDLAQLRYPYLPWGIYPSLFDSINKIESIKVPKLVMHSIDDQIVPFKLGEKLYQSAALPKEFIMLSGRHIHGFVDDQEKYSQTIRNFIDNLK